MAFPITFNLNYEFSAFHKGIIKKVNLLKDFPNKYIILIFYPYDFTFVCPTEINTLSDKIDKYPDTEIIVASCDSVYSHQHWETVARSERGINGCKLIMLSDYERILGRYLDIFEKIEDDKGNLVESNHARCTFILDGNFNVIHFSYYKKEMGRNTDELLRIIQMNKEIEKNGQNCFCDWK